MTSKKDKHRLNQDFKNDKIPIPTTLNKLFGIILIKASFAT